MTVEKISKKTMIKHFTLAMVLLVMGFIAPILGEMARVETVGEEHVCCMPYDYDAAYQKAEYAKENRGLANLYMIGGMVLGLMMAVTAGVFFYGSLKRAELKRWLKIVLGIVFGLVLLLALFWAAGGLVVFFRDIDGYYALGGWGHIYYQIP